MLLSPAVIVESFSLLKSLVDSTNVLLLVKHDTVLV
jgi:hypothetical protein